MNPSMLTPHFVKVRYLIGTWLFCFVFLADTVQAQPSFRQQAAGAMEFPGVVAMATSPSHMYVLSESEGMAVFRSYPDSLQWLYTSAGMQRRGTTIRADVRFAYLYGDSRRLTVLEPTSVLGVYSSTLLPAKPLGVARAENQLYIALGNAGLGSLSLESPETVDQEPKIVQSALMESASVLDVTTNSLNQQLFVLLDNQKLLLFTSENNTLSLSSTISLSQSINRLFLDEEQLFGATANGELYAINSTGLSEITDRIGAAIQHLEVWEDRIWTLDVTGKLWVTDTNGTTIWKEDAEANYAFTTSPSSMWVHENGRIAKVGVDSSQVEESQRLATGDLKLATVPKQIHPFPKPFIYGFELENPFPLDEVTFTVRSNVSNVVVQGQGMIWSPGVQEIGVNWFQVIATSTTGQVDSTRFIVELTSFNAPPRFSPVRNVSIPYGERYTFPFKATDPDQTSSAPVRYLGVDVPDGAQIDEQTGLFVWNPTEAQVGEHRFRVLATDQFGAAASIDISMTVLNITRNGSN
ncbi:MAG: Ig domain-containing protein [Bacteroidota bacterium]